jgi:putative ABC transport system ATP-binding protein
LIDVGHEDNVDNSVESVEPAAVSPVVELRDLWRVFPSEPPVNALRNINLSVQGGDYLAVVGASGSGKSTLLNVLGLLDRHTSGHYLLDGLDTAEMSDSDRARERSRRLGFVFQSFHLLSHRSVEENVMLAELYRGTPRAGRLERAVEALTRVGLRHRIGFLPTRLSGGERQRVAIARALVGNPSLLLCDEPTGNLDSHNTSSVLELFGDLHQHGLTIVVITHDSNVAGQAHRKVNMTDGELVEVR